MNPRFMAIGALLFLIVWGLIVIVRRGGNRFADKVNEMENSDTSDEPERSEAGPVDTSDTD
tara:strand:+ start:873 stop:1055 length:183 start_codon:yes stop_codon:yes gene_type:complete